MPLSRFGGGSRLIQSLFRLWSKRPPHSHNKPTMKLSISFLVATLTASAISSAQAFVQSPSRLNHHLRQSFSLQMADTIFEGKPTERALNLDIRQEVAKSSFFTVNGDTVTMNELLGEPSSSGVSVVVFLRSLGWPLCQEHILQYSKRRDELLESGVKLVMVSIGKPEVGEFSSNIGTVSLLVDMWTIHSLTCHYALHRKRTYSSFGTKRRRRIHFHRYGVNVLFHCVARSVRSSVIALTHSITHDRPRECLVWWLGSQTWNQGNFLFAKYSVCLFREIYQKGRNERAGWGAFQMEQGLLYSTKARAGLFARWYVCIWWPRLYLCSLWRVNGCTCQCWQSSGTCKVASPQPRWKLDNAVEA